MLPHLQAVAALTDDDPDTYILPGVEILNAPRAEVDLVGVYRGEFVVGEAKTFANQWTAEQVDGDLELATRLRVQAYLIAASGGISDAAMAYATTAAEQRQIKLICIRGSELVWAIT